MIEIELAGEPVGKGRPRFVKATGRAFTPEKTVRYEDRLAVEAQHVMAGRPLLEGPLLVCVEAYLQVPKSKPERWKTAALVGQVRPTKKPDWDNFGKILDALNLVVWADDAQIVDGRVVKFYSDRPRLRVTVEPVKQGVFE